MADGEQRLTRLSEHRVEVVSNKMPNMRPYATVNPYETNIYL